MNPFVLIILYFTFFALSLYGLSAFDFKKILHSQKTTQAQIFILLLAMCIAYISVQFLLGITFSIN